MEPIDVAFEKFGRIVDEDLPQYTDTLVSEADVRMKLIDRIFVEVLGWPYSDVHLESQAGDGFIDYRCTIDGLNRLIIEAKRKGRDLGIREDRSGRYFKLNGPVFDSAHAQEGIKQAINYCGFKSAELACVTNGRQWIVFRGNRCGDGRETLDGMGCVFGSLDGLRADFKLFYDLLSYESVRGYRYRAEFQNAEGQPIRASDFRSAIRQPESRNLLTADKLYEDIDRVMMSFFRDLSGDDDPELRRHCFVTSGESDQAEKGIARISEELRNKVRMLRTTASTQIEKAIERVLKMQRHEFVLIVGTKGAGKTTFIDRLFEDILPANVKQDCVIVRVDLSKSGADESTIISWLDQHFLEAAERAVFGDRAPTYDEIRGMYYREFDRWKDGVYKPLYEKDPNEFKIEFGRHVEKRREERPHEHIVNLLHRIVHSDGKVPCLVFDNADHFTIEFQDRVFQYANSLYKDILCLVIVPITDKTSWQLSRQGALQSFFFESYFLPTPPPDIVLRKRVDYIEQKIKDDARPEKGRGYFFGRGLELSLDDLRGFTSSVQAVFINTGEVANWIGNLSNRDIRRCLQLTREIIGSPHIQVHELLKAAFTHTAMEVNADNAKLAIIRGKYDIYPVGQSAFVQNIYALTTEIDTTPLLGLRILQFLEDTHFQRAEGEARYVEVGHVKEFFLSMNIEPRATAQWLDALLKCGLVLSYDPTVSGIEKAFRVEIAPAGLQHLTWGLTDWIYMESMLDVTPFLEQAVFEEIRGFLLAELAFARRKAIRYFLLYLLREDARYAIVPDHPKYGSQVNVKTRIEDQCVRLTLPMTDAHSTRYGRPYGKVTEWKQDGGYGFIAPEGGRGAKVFVHIRDVLDDKAASLGIGSCVEYDLIETDKGFRALKVATLS